MRVVERNGLIARCEARGVARTVNLMLLPDEVAVCDHVMVHAGNAIQVMTGAEAARAWELYDEMLAVVDAAPSGHHEG